jgi:guanylate kinase
MKTIFLVDGAAGTGKSDMVRYICEEKQYVAKLVEKFTTRKKRQEEFDKTSDLKFPEDTYEQFLARKKDKSFYWYKYGNREFGEELYGFYGSDVEKALQEYDFVFIIVRDHQTIEAIKKDFHHVRVVAVFIYADRDLVIERLRCDNHSEQDIQLRLSRQPLAWGDYLKHSTDYDEVLINSSRREEYEILLESLFKKYSSAKSNMLEITPKHTYTLFAPLDSPEYKDVIEHNLQVYPFHKNVFLMMKFRGEKNQLVYGYIKDTLATYGLNCVRADETDWNITGNTYNPVAVLYCCKYGIALFDEPEPSNDYSPNVAYELGIMHSQGKECLILISTLITNIPFDLAKDLYVPYKSELELKGILEKWVSKIKNR